MAAQAACVDLSHSYILIKELGSGAFATVFLAEHKLSHMKVAIKTIDRESFTEEGSDFRLVREINIIKQADHPFIAKLYEVIRGQRYTYLVMEYEAGGSILDHVNEHGRLTEVTARRYFSQILSALEYLHDVCRVAHRDLKAENVLLDRNLNVRLIDFGLSNLFQSDEQLRTCCGSPAYAAPEMILGLPYTKAVDVWSAGVLLYAMVAGRLPFDDASPVQLLEKVAYSEPEFPQFISPQLYDLLMKLLMKDPNCRITIPRIKEHPWFSRTEYARFLEFRFANEEQWLVRGIDHDIVAIIGAMGMDTKELAHSLLSGEYTDSTTLYSIYRRDSLTDKIRSFMAELADRGGLSVRRESGDGLPLQTAVRQFSGNAPRPMPTACKRVPRPQGLLLRPPIKPLPRAAVEVGEPPEESSARKKLLRPRAISVSNC